MPKKTSYKKKISVIVPVYNVELYLEKCLDSLVNQDFDDYEIIVVNDGSTDNSQLIIDKYKEKYPNLIKAFIKQNGGLSSARNYGIENSTGEYLMFLDSDDYIALDSLKKLYDKAVSDKADIVVYNYYSVENGNLIKIGEPNYKSKSNVSKYIIGQPSACNKFIKSSIFLKNNIWFPGGKYYEDLGTLPLLALYTNKITFLDEYLYYYVQRENSIMNKKKYNKKMEDIFWVLNNISSEYKKKNLYDKYYEEIEFLYINHLLKSASLRFLSYENQKNNLNKIISIMKSDFPNWKNNLIYKQCNFKYKVMCNLLFYKKYGLINLLRKKVK